MQGSLPVAAGGCLQLVAADITQQQTLRPDMFDGVRAVVSCTAVKVQPKEGDTADRAKYYQVSGLGFRVLGFRRVNFGHVEVWCGEEWSWGGMFAQR